MVSLESLNEGIAMVARSWTDMSNLQESEIDAEILVF